MPDERPVVSLSTVTSTSLLDGLLKPENRTVWQQFVERYRPLIVGYARRFGLSHQEAEDAAQQSLMAFCTAYQNREYDRAKGRLRKWLFGIAHRQIMNWIRSQRRRDVPVGGGTDGTDLVGRIPDENEMEKHWEQEWREAVIRECLKEVRSHHDLDEKTVQAFELFVLKDKRAKEVAEQLGMSENAVYLAKHKMLRRFRELLPQVEEAW